MVRGIKWIKAASDGLWMVGSKGCGSPCPLLALFVGNATMVTESEETLMGGRCREGRTSQRVTVRRALGR